jgi:hypothetical protein
MVTSAMSDMRTGKSLRRSHRTALGNVMSSVRTALAAASTLVHFSASASSPSTAARSPLSRLARQSGNRL